MATGYSHATAADKNVTMPTRERGRIPGIDLEVFRVNHIDLLNTLNAGQLVNALFQTGLIDDDDMASILEHHKKSRMEGMEAVLRIIRDSGPRVFTRFIESLRVAGYNDTADKLKTDYNKITMLQQDETEEPKTGNVKQLTVELKRRDEEVRLEKVEILERRPNDVREMKDNLNNVSDKCQRLQELNKKLELERIGLTERVEFLERRSNDVSDKYQKEGDINKNLEEEDHKMKEKQISELMERVCVLEGRSSDKFNFAKLPPFPRINTDGINTDVRKTDGRNTDGRKTVLDFIRRKKDLNTDGRKTLEDIVERCEDWKRKIKDWVKNRDDCLDKLVKWWEGEQYKDVDVFKRDVKEWRDVLYKCLFSQVEMYDSFIEWIQFVCSLPDCLYVSLPGRLYVSLYDRLDDSLPVSLHDGGLMWESKDEFYRQIDDYKRQQDKVKVKIERCINRLDQIISDEGKDNTGTSKDNTFCISFSSSYYSYDVDLTSAQTNFVRIYKHLKL